MVVVMRAIPLLLATALLGACSSVPDFRPTKPIEEASSLQEARELCGAYRIESEQNASGKMRPVRVPALVPWINCFEKTFRRFPAARMDEDYVMFFRALQARHDGVAAANIESVDPAAMNFVVGKIVEHLGKPELPFSRIERAEIDRQLPGYGMYLAESGRLGNLGSSRAAVRRSELSALNGSESLAVPDAGLAAPSARSLRLNESQKEYCKRYRAYQSVVSNLADLSEYRAKLEEQTYADGTNANERAMRDRVQKRHDSLKEEAETQKTALDQELGRLRATSVWFQSTHCLQPESIR
jgi:hypothetical protein